MSDSKSYQFRPPLYTGESRRTESNEQSDANGEAKREQQGWDAYRKWLSSVNGKQQSRRAPIDHSIYSWKGYHNWADRVRQTWKSEEN